MGGTNPYIKEVEVKKPSQKFHVRVENVDRVIEVDPAKIPFGDTGLPGSLLDILLNAGIEMDHACGGVCACATCHIYVKQGGDSCPPPEEAENDMLDMAPDINPTSRLACQCVPSGDTDITVEIPSWNRNYAREGT